MGLLLLQFKKLLYPSLEANIFRRYQFLRHEKQRKQHGGLQSTTPILLPYEKKTRGKSYFESSNQYMIQQADREVFFRSRRLSPHSFCQQYDGQV